MSKLISLFYLLIFLSLAGYGQKIEKCIIHGHVLDCSLDGVYATLEKSHLFSEKGDFRLDSVLIREGKFYFETETAEQPFFAFISIPGRKLGHIIIEPGEVRFVLPALNQSAEVSGTSINDAYTQDVVIKWNDFRKADTLFDRKEKAMNAGTWTVKEEAHYQELFPTDLALAITEGKFHFMETYVSFPELIMTMLYTEYSQHLDIKGYADSDRLKHLMTQLPDSVISRLHKEYQDWKKLYNDYIKNNPDIVKEIAQKSHLKEELSDSVQPGKLFIDFRGITEEADTTSISNLIKGKKLILLDFWASWCGPCMAAMPELAMLYAKYREKGLEIIGLSSDDQINTWKKAIKDKSMIWPQLHMFKEKNKDPMDVYEIFFIPYTILLDAEGRIIARNPESSELKKKIAEILN